MSVFLNPLTDTGFKTMNDQVFARLAEMSKIAALSEDDRIRYERDLKWSRDYHTEMAYAREQGLEAGLAEGRAEGRAEGIAEGREEGMAEGIAIGREASLSETAKRMKQMGLTNEQITMATGLSSSQIEAL